MSLGCRESVGSQWLGREDGGQEWLDWGRAFKGGRAELMGPADAPAVWGNGKSIWDGSGALTRLVEVTKPPAGS